MLSILALDSRALRRVSVAVASVALLTACDSDNAVAPNPTPTAGNARAAVISNRPAMGRVRQTYLDVVGPIGGMSLKLRNHAAGTETSFRENFARRGSACRSMLVGKARELRMRRALLVRIGNRLVRPEPAHEQPQVASLPVHARIQARVSAPP